jgi:hypothetical protein
MTTIDLDSDDGGDSWTQLSDDTGDVFSDSSPRWSNIDDRIYYVHREGGFLTGVSEIFSMLSDGSTHVQLTEGSGINTAIELSDDGSFFVYGKVLAGDLYPTLHLHDILSSSELPVGLEDDREPSLFRDGDTMVVSRNLEDGDDLELVIVDVLTGIEIFRLTDDALSNGTADVSKVNSADVDVLHLW